MNKHKCICEDIVIKDFKHKIGPCGAIVFVGKKYDICAECGKEIKDINPLKKSAYKRLQKMQLKDLADKVEEIVIELNRLR